MGNGLVLSVFPGIDLLGRAFEEEGYCVVRGPDLLWGGDIRTFYPPAGVFEGVIGGPPCKGESKLAHLNGDVGASLVEEFWRIVDEVQPEWWMMEAVTEHDAPYVLKLNNRWLGEKQHRKRYFHSGLNLKPHIEVALFEHPEWRYAVLAGHGGTQGTVTNRMAKYPWPEACELQGLPPDFDIPPFKSQWKYEVIGNAVPMAMGRAIAKAIKRATNGCNPERSEPCQRKR